MRLGRRPRPTTLRADITWTAAILAANRDSKSAIAEPPGRRLPMIRHDFAKRTMWRWVGAGVLRPHRKRTAGPIAHRTRRTARRRLAPRTARDAGRAAKAQRIATGGIPTEPGGAHARAQTAPTGGTRRGGIPRKSRVGTGSIGSMRRYAGGCGSLGRSPSQAAGWGCPPYRFN